jgi:hypothetical protein
MEKDRGHVGTFSSNGAIYEPLYEIRVGWLRGEGSTEIANRLGGVAFVQRLISANDILWDRQQASVLQSQQANADDQNPNTQPNELARPGEPAERHVQFLRV